MSNDPEEVCKRMMGATITGIQITDDETVRITLNNGWMEFEGEGLEVYVELEDVN